MSFTSTIQRQSSPTKTLLLSPSKRRRLSPPLDEPPPAPSVTELWKWTLTSGAIAPCFIRDVFAMTENAEKGIFEFSYFLFQEIDVIWLDADFFWLGRVPCRNVRLVAVVVGVKVYEKRILYSVDDGTSVIDCVHRQTPPSPTKHSAQTKSTNVLKTPSMPKPIARVGNSVRLVGKVTKWHDSSQIILEQIARCTSANEEPTHWRTVRALHQSSYMLPGPFIIPPPATVSVQDSNASSSSSTNPTANDTHPYSRPAYEPQTPSSTTTFSTPASSTVSSPAKSILSHQQSPPKLRHPSRLHSRDLTANTFRIYLKHYMDNAPLEPTSISPESEDECDSVAYALDNAPSTPTKRPRHAQGHTPDQTPRPSGSRNVDECGVDRTPRPSIPTLLSGRKDDNSLAPRPLSQDHDDPASVVRGFTLSYLRRVPELSDMARRVVKAEAKRRAREERKKVKEASQKDKGNAVAPHRGGPPVIDKERAAPKMKRLFSWAIVKLYEEGSIVLWDGPVRKPLGTAGQNITGLWKANTTTNTTLGADSTVFSSVGGITQAEDEDFSDGELSDPQPNEEAYIPLTSTYLASHVEKAIGTLVARASQVESSRPRAGSATAVARRQNPRAPAAGPTKEEITAFLRRTDERWARVGDWAVDDALEVLKREGRAWTIGKGRWELCL